MPHLREDGAAYHVIWRLHRSQGALRDAERDRVLSAIRFFDGRRYELLVAVVMDDHVHAVLVPAQGHPLERIVHSWKSYTAHELCKRGRRAPVWQDEYYDRILRSDEQLWTAVAYAIWNPCERWPDVQSYPWLWVIGGLEM